MGNKKLVFVLTASQDYLRHANEDEKKYTAVTNSLFESISDSYIPLLKMLENLEKYNVAFKVALVLPPMLCTLLEDPVVQKQYNDWLDKKIEFGQKEIVRTASNPELLKLAKYCFEKNQEDKLAFESYGQRIIKKFGEYQKKGYVEILATCGTDMFLPFYNEMTEVINAQIEAGLYSYKSFFGEVPDGFWLPLKGYYPGIEKNVKNYGFNYTILDTRSFLFSEIEPKNGIFTPARFINALGALSCDPETEDEIYGEEGFAHNSVFRNEARDVGYMLSQEELLPFVEKGTSRYALGYKYWNKTAIDEEELCDANGLENVYSPADAFECCERLAKSYVEKKKEILEKAASYIDKDVSLVVTIDMNKLRKNWVEGIHWIENVLRIAAESGIETVLPKTLIGNPFELQRIKPYYGASSGTGYGEELLSSKNNWMMKYVRKAGERMIDLAERFPAETGLKARLLNLGAKELMLAQSCGWAKMIDSDEFPEYAESRFKQSINDFTAVFDALGSNTVSTEWLTNLENKHQFFPWMNYRIFSKKH